MDTQVLVDELVMGYAEILRLTVIIGELGQHNLTVLRECQQRERESKRREVKLRDALQLVQRWRCWCDSEGLPTLEHSIACKNAYRVLHGTERGMDAKA